MCLHWCSLATATSRHKLLSAVSVSRAVLCYLLVYLQPRHLLPPPAVIKWKIWLPLIKTVNFSTALKTFDFKGKRQGRPWGEWSIQGCASQSWSLRQGRCRRSAVRRHPAISNSVIIDLPLNGVFSPVEALVGTRSEEIRQAAGRGKPRRLSGSQGRGSQIGSLSCGTWYRKVRFIWDGKRQIKGLYEQPVKKYLGSLASHCKGAAILTECDMGDSIWILL